MPSDNPATSDIRAASGVANGWGLLAILAVGIECYLLLEGGYAWADVPRITATVFVLAWAPGSLVGLATRRLRSRDPGRLVRALLFWTVPLAGIAISVVASLDTGQLSGMEATIILAALPAVVGVTHVFLPSFREDLPHHLFPTLVVWLGGTLVLAWLSTDRLAMSLSPLTFLPGLLALPALIGPFVHRFMEGVEFDATWKKQTARLLYAAIFAAAYFVLQSWLVGLNLRLKAWVPLAFAAGWVALFEPSAGVGRSRVMTGITIALPIVAGVAGIVFLTLADVPARFGAHPYRTLVGSTAGIFSLADDGDGDRFYDANAGGNDCDDSDAARHPAALETENNCWASDAAEADATPNSQDNDVRDVVVFLIDSLRPEIVHDAEMSRRFPTLRRLEATSVRYRSAYSPGNSTFTSVPTMLTGVSPIAVIRASVTGDPPFSRLTEGRWVFDAARERCTAFLAQGHTDWMFQFYPTDLDFTAYDTAEDERGYGAPFALEHFHEALETCGDRPLLWVVYMDDPHIDDFGHTCAAGGEGGYECFLDEIDAVEEVLAEMMSLLDDRTPKPMVIVTADHGEAFGEHGYTAHSSTVHEEQIHVPLLVRIPGMEPRDVQTPVTLLGLPATLKDAIGAPADAADTYPSWLPLARDPDAPYPAPVAENWVGYARIQWTTPTSALRDGEWKLVYDWFTNARRLYDLEADPQETTNLCADAPARCDRLMGLFRERQVRLITGSVSK